MTQRLAPFLIFVPTSSDTLFRSPLTIGMMLPKIHQNDHTILSKTSYPRHHPKPAHLLAHPGLLVLRAPVRTSP